MARPLTRDERIRLVMEDNQNSSHPFERTEGYAQAYVNGQISIEERTKIKMTREEAIRIVNERLNQSGQAGVQYINAERTIGLYEALGLIKFDDKPKQPYKFQYMEGNFVTLVLDQNGTEITISGKIKKIT